MPFSGNKNLISARTSQSPLHDKEKVTAHTKPQKFLKPSDVRTACLTGCHSTITTSKSNHITNINNNNITTTTSDRKNATDGIQTINTSSTSMITKAVVTGPPSLTVAASSSPPNETNKDRLTISATTLASNISSVVVDGSVSTTNSISKTTATTLDYETAAASESNNRKDKEDDTDADEIHTTIKTTTTTTSSLYSTFSKGQVDSSCIHCNLLNANSAGTDNIRRCSCSPRQETVLYCTGSCSSGESNSFSTSASSTCTNCSCSFNSSCNSKCSCSCARKSGVDSGSCISSSFPNSTKTKSSNASDKRFTVNRESPSCESYDPDSFILNYGLFLKGKTDTVHPKQPVNPSSKKPADNGYCSCCFGKNSPSSQTDSPTSFLGPRSVSSTALITRVQSNEATSRVPFTGTNCENKKTQAKTEEITVRSPSHSPKAPVSSTSPTRIAAADSGKIGVGSSLLTSKPVQFASRQPGLQASPVKSVTTSCNSDGRRKHIVPSALSSNSRDNPSKHRKHKLCFPHQTQLQRQQKSCISLTRRGSNVSNISRGGGWKFNKMGNGSSHGSGGHVVIDGESLEVSRIKTLIPEMRRELRKKESMIARYEAELHEKIRELKERTADVQRLKGEVHKLRSVLQLKVCNEEGRPDILATIQETLPNNNAGDQRLKRQGVSGESYNNSGGFSSIELKHHDKDFRSRQLIKDSILENDFLKNLDQNQVREIVDCMYEKKVKMGHFIIKEAESGQHLYVSAEGEFDVVKGKQVLGKMGPGRAFGELAILYNCTRTASVRAVSDVRIWVLDRRVFQAIMMKTGIQRREENIQFLKSVSLLKDLPNDKLAKIADVLEVDFFRGGEYIIREDAYGDSFFIINRGEVKVTQTIQGHSQPQEIRRLKRGDYFGEKALLSEDRRTANVIALGQGVECLTVDRNSFNKLIGDLNELKEKDYGDEARGAHRSSGGQGSSSHEIESPTKEKPDKDFDDIRLEHMEVIATLGVGGFGRVELVQLSTDKNRTFALKCLKKKHIVETRQQDHIYSEKKIMMDSKSPFVVKMYRTFTDKKYVYMLMEACLGGELWSILRDKGQFEEGMSRFYIACVLEALEYLHGKHIIYRDLKPENLLLDKHGYIKLVDFGFAKRVPSGRKTWTFCGTPEYVAPEIILNKGHDHAVDYWGLGILMFELLNGTPPFSGHDPMKTYNVILKGIDVIEFPKRFSRNSILIIKKLCRENPSERLGYGKNGLSDIKKNKWFQGFDWDGLKKQKLIPPIVPKVRSQCDHSNFDQYSKDTEVPPDETSGWDNEF